MPWLRLHNGLPVTPVVGAAPIQLTRLVEIAEQYRPQQGPPPVDSSLSVTLKRLQDRRPWMVTDEQVKKKKLMKIIQTGVTQTVAAAKVGWTDKTARK